MKKIIQKKETRIPTLSEIFNKKTAEDIYRKEMEEKLAMKNMELKISEKIYNKIRNTDKIIKFKIGNERTNIGIIFLLDKGKNKYAILKRLGYDKPRYSREIYTKVVSEILNDEKTFDKHIK